MFHETEKKSWWRGAFILSNARLTTDIEDNYFQNAGTGGKIY